MVLKLHTGTKMGHNSPLFVTSGQAVRRFYRQKKIETINELQIQRQLTPRTERGRKRKRKNHS